MAGKTYKTTDPDVIRSWAAVRGGEPAVMSGSADVAQQALPCIVFSDYNYAKAYLAHKKQNLEWPLGRGTYSGGCSMPF